MRTETARIRQSKQERRGETDRHRWTTITSSRRMETGGFHRKFSGGHRGMSQRRLLGVSVGDKFFLTVNNNLKSISTGATGLNGMIAAYRTSLLVYQRAMEENGWSDLSVDRWELQMGSRDDAVCEEQVTAYG